MCPHMWCLLYISNSPCDITHSERYAWSLRYHLYCSLPSYGMHADPPGQQSRTSHQIHHSLRGDINCHTCYTYPGICTKGIICTKINLWNIFWATFLLIVCALWSQIYYRLFFPRCMSLGKNRTNNQPSPWNYNFLSLFEELKKTSQSAQFVASVATVQKSQRMSTHKKCTRLK